MIVGEVIIHYTNQVGIKDTWQAMTGSNLAKILTDVKALVAQLEEVEHCTIDKIIIKP